MTLRMGDGPVANLPAGLDAVAGYVNQSGIGQTYPEVVAKFPNARHLSITTDGTAALVADVESGAMSEWTGYPYGYCAVSNVNALIARYGRPRKLWTAHYDPSIGAHICSPACWPGLVTTADGTQWTNHGAANWDESLLADDFFDLTPPPPPLTGGQNMQAIDPVTGGIWTLGSDGHVEAEGGAPYLGGLQGDRFGWQAVGPIAGFSARKDGNGEMGYDVAVATSKPNPDGTWFDHYTFPRNGSAA